ncbi:MULTISPECIES: hypothetical protein [Rhodovulum]|uniref:Uncharacterized protein n=2 Tax=Rhodovulum TaxID=34008 RepID=A0A8E3APM5_9RHOB|nr:MULTISPECIES: hypothetical protein [Rhodovulum]PTW46167.1 hypothetical protein C8N38_112125 [Rhodovulum kholense]RAP40920.1 hypothetical protein BYZ73_13180 [Rhodovulum viride]
MTDISAVSGSTFSDGGPNVAVAVLAALLLGPFGLFYVSRVAAIVMIVLTFVIALPTLGFGVLLTLPLGMLWAGIAAIRLRRRAMLAA